VSIPGPSPDPPEKAARLGGAGTALTRVYENLGATFGSAPVWSFAGEDSTVAVALGDAEAEGDLDLACGNTGLPPTMPRERTGRDVSNRAESDSLHYERSGLRRLPRSQEGQDAAAILSWRNRECGAVIARFTPAGAAIRPRTPRGCDLP